MRKRTRISSSPEQNLIDLAKEWHKSIFNLKDVEAAIKAREKAEPLFEEHPEWKAGPPTNIPKAIYIDWVWFVRFLEPDYQKAYLTTAETNKWPPKQFLND